SLVNSFGPNISTIETVITRTYSTNPPFPLQSETFTPTQFFINQSYSGAFTAKITSDKAVIAFKGDNTGIFSTAVNGTPTLTNRFSVNGM
ncbi:MAG: hypothetical protein ACKOKC_17905, partial [Chthoniobacterales bacterium]